ncbi:TOTE conflict system archaeo-eukaryotic primase domain-containing protein [Kaistella yonginensis]|uniref:TOTE conflict system archaeo-eukaryotic primase domain-containing protein n=1 Tax=Kaistella yonginensis TaxID=658267 RepID=UPI003F499221
MNESISDNINSFHTLFQGREEVFYIRWEKSGKAAGYIPAYHYNPYHCHPFKLSLH